MCDTQELVNYFRDNGNGTFTPKEYTDNSAKIAIHDISQVIGEVNIKNLKNNATRINIKLDGKNLQSGKFNGIHKIEDIISFIEESTFKYTDVCYA